jgi:uncharacterized protein with PIN domain
MQRKFALQPLPFDAYRKGINPKARLNLFRLCGLCAREHHERPLLFKGDDFAQADLTPC